MSWSSSVCTLVLLRTSKSSVSKSESSNSSGVWGQRGKTRIREGQMENEGPTQEPSEWKNVCGCACYLPSLKSSWGMCCYWSLTHSQVWNAKPSCKYSTINVNKSLLKSKHNTETSLCRLSRQVEVYYHANYCFLRLYSCLKFKSIMHLEFLTKQDKPRTALRDIKTILLSRENEYDFRYKVSETQRSLFHPRQYCSVGQRHRLGSW